MNMNASILIPLILVLGFVSIVVTAIVYFRSELEPEVLRQRFLPPLSSSWAAASS